MSDEPSALEQLGQRVRRLPWTWPLPALVVNGLVLLFSARVWTDTVTVHSRSGDSSTMSVGGRYVVLLCGAAGFYSLICLLPDVLFLGGRVGMRPPTEAEKGCVLAMLRFGLLAVLYGSAWTLLRDYG